jgi:hypothetical protein
MINSGAEGMVPGHFGHMYKDVILEAFQKTMRG